MMYLPSQEELLAKQQQQREGQEYHQQQQQYQRQTLNESDEDALADTQSLSSSVLECGENDLKDADSETRSLIAHLTDLDVSDSPSPVQQRDT